MKINFPFSAWPYISLALPIVGILVRYLLARKNMDAVRSEIAEAKEIFAGSKLWRVVLLLLAIAHVGLLAFPQLVQSWNSKLSRLYFLEAFLALLGTIALCCSLVLVWRYLGRVTRTALVELGDAIFLSLLLVGIVSGLVMAIVYRWASMWSTITLGPYIASLVSGRPSAQFITQMPVLVRMHVFSAFAAVAVLPVTRLSAAILLALHHGLGFVSRPALAMGQALASRLRKHDPAAWIWPEED